MSKTNHNLNRYPELLPVLAVVLALAAAAICVPAEEADAADSGSCGDGVVWSFEGDTLSVTYTGEGTGRMDDHSDPMEFGYASLWKSINNVVIGEGVTYLGYCAFNGFAIKSITLSSTVEEIGRSSLAGNDITSVDLKNVVRIGQSAFNENKKLESVVIPSTVESIGNYAFDLCESLANADTSGATSLTSIGNSAFVHNAITSFYVPASVTSLGTGIFAECFNLGTINVDEANENYVSVDGVVYDAGMTAVLHFPAAKECALYEIPDTVTSVGSAAFANSYRMRAVTIPDSVTVISNNGFEKSTGLTSIKIPATVTSIGNFAFNSCENIKTIDFSGTTVLKSIGEGAFLSCSSIKTVEIPKCVESLGIRAFGH
ncbi:MAG: leucine-rich repeat domain-containing protein, partial [Candidatus Methanomethylophilaceae archaeon]|nr:leucine-rich repeat domain-containing protein [Candidatus Methanomethylophilaceae archaeon]